MDNGVTIAFIKGKAIGCGTDFTNGHGNITSLVVHVRRHE